MSPASPQVSPAPSWPHLLAALALRLPLADIPRFSAPRRARPYIDSRRNDRLSTLVHRGKFLEDIETLGYLMKILSLQAIIIDTVTQLQQGFMVDDRWLQVQSQLCCVGKDDPPVACGRRCYDEGVGAQLPQPD